MRYLLAISLLAAQAFAVTPPTPPQLQVDTTMPTVTGKSISVSSGGDLQGAINAANPGDEIVLAAGGTWTGNYTLPNKGANSAWIIIRSSAVSSLPASGHRVAPSDAANMPKIQAAGSGAAFTIAPQANHYRLVGLEITEQPSQALNYGLIMEGDPNDANAADLPSYIVADRCYMHGEVLSHIKFGMQLNGSYMAVVDSYLSEFHGIGQDTQALFSYMGSGPFKIVNNFLEGSGENILFGGAWAAIPNAIAADVTVIGNYFYKPDTWRTQSIIPAPANVLVTPLTGSLAAGTYYYAVIAQGSAGTITDGSAQSSRSAEVTGTVAATGNGSFLLTWAADNYGDATFPGKAQSYVVARTTDAPGASPRNWTYFETTTTSLADDGTLTPLSSYSEYPRYWDVKNLFEVKNGTRFFVDSNVFEGNWVSAQNGYSILFTPRMEYPCMQGNHVSDITFSNNVVRHVSGGINIASEDDARPATDWPYLKPTSRLAFTNNLFDDVSWNYNGNGNFMEIEPGAEPSLLGAQDILFDHNTVFQQGNFVTIMAQGPPLNNFQFTNNVFAEGTYGWFVSGLGQTYSAIQQEISNLAFTGNVWAGDPGAYQVPGNQYPASLSAVGFVNLNNGDNGNYQLATSSPYKVTAAGGSDPGADMGVLNTVIANATGGINGGSTVIVPPPPPPPVVAVAQVEKVIVGKNVKETEATLGTIDGKNAVFNLSYLPTSNASVIVFLNGILQREGRDYTLTGKTITFTKAPASGSTIDVNYQGEFNA